MIKWIISLLILVIVALAAVLFLKDDPGLVSIRFHEYSLDTSLVFAVVAVLLFSWVMQLLFRFMLWVWRFPKLMAAQADRNRRQRSRKLLNLGLMDLAEGRFTQAETNLTKLVDYADNPLINYLAAARAAHQLGQFDQRDNFLKAAHDLRPDAEIAISVSQAELQLSAGQTERALATLKRLRSVSPKHDYILKLLARVYGQLEDWQQLCELLPDIRKKKLFREKRLEELERKTYEGCLNQSAKQSLAALEASWKRIPVAVQGRAELILLYLKQVGTFRKPAKEHCQLLIKALGQHWHPDLVSFYGKLEVEEPSEQLKIAEKWLEVYGESDVLLLTLGRICIRLKLWGKAEGFLEASIGIKPTPENCLEFARLLDRPEMNASVKACNYFRQGLDLCLKEMVAENTQNQSLQALANRSQDS